MFLKGYTPISYSMSNLFLHSTFVNYIDEYFLCDCRMYRIINNKLWATLLIHKIPLKYVM